MTRKAGGKPGFLVLPAVLILLAAALMTGTAAAEEAEDITSGCRIGLSSPAGRIARITDGKYTTSCESEKTGNPWMTVTSGRLIYGLYLCFSVMPDEYVVQRENGSGEWETLYRGNTDFCHVFYPLDGCMQIRVYVPSGGRTVMGFNEVYVFGDGEVPGWVQQWEPAPEKADILFLAAHPDDDLLFLGGAIAWYGVEQQRDIVVAYLTESSNARRSEALNGLWTLGIRTYPVFGGFPDCDVGSDRMKDIYRESGGQDRVQGWVTELYRRFRPDVVVTHDPEGEYGHMQHKMMADAAAAAYELAALPDRFPESALKYGTWHVLKLYLHLYGDPEEQTRFNWDVPLASLGGMTANERAEEAFSRHESQQGKGRVSRGVTSIFSVAEYGVKRFPNTAFGLYATRVGPDIQHDDFLENTLPIVIDDEDDE